MVKSPKQKGNRLEYEISKLYNRKLDPFARRMPLSGAAKDFKGDILKRFYDGWSDECKSREKMKVYDWWNQTVMQAGQAKPVLFLKANNKEILAVIKATDYFDLREELEDYKKSSIVDFSNNTTKSN